MLKMKGPVSVRLGAMGTGPFLNNQGCDGFSRGLAKIPGPWLKNRVVLPS